MLFVFLRISVPFVFFVSLTALMMVWLNYSGNLATLNLTIVIEEKVLCASKPKQKLQAEIFKFVKRVCLIFADILGEN